MRVKHDADLQVSGARPPGRPRTGPRWMLREAKNLYLDRQETRDRKPNTLHQQRHRLEIVERIIGWEKDLRTWTRDDESKYIKTRKAEGVCNRTINHERITLKSAVRCSIDEERLLPTASLLSIAKPALPVPKSDPQGLTDQEFEKLRKAAREGKFPERTELVILISGHTGLRHREACQLACVSVDLEAGMLALPSWSTKANSDRRIPLSLELKASLENYMASIPKGQVWLFPGTRLNQPLDNVSAYIRAAYKAADLYRKFNRPGMHVLRKMWATKMSRKTTMDTLRNMAGWASLKSAEPYFVARDEDKREAISQVFDAAPPLKPAATPADAGGISPAALLRYLVEVQGKTMEEAYEAVEKMKR